MEKVDKVLSYLAFARRTGSQLLDIKNLKYLHLIFRGFTPNKGYFYDFKKYGYKSYVTDTTRYLNTVFINYTNRDLLGDKYSCYLFLKDFTDKIVPVYGLVDDGNIFMVNAYKDEAHLFAHEQKFVLKPRTGRGGDGVVVLRAEQGRFYLGDRNSLDLRELLVGLKNYILVPYVQQHSYSAAIFPDSLNTIRLMTGVLDDRVVLLRAGHRFGNVNTRSVDNFSQGGVSTIIDIETGVLQDPVTWDAKSRRRCSVTHHPATHAPILGVEIPGWAEMKNSMLQLHEAIKFIKYVGWDVAITADGYRIIEANYASDVDGTQIHYPLLMDEANQRFFGKYEFKPFLRRPGLGKMFQKASKKIAFLFLL